MISFGNLNFFFLNGTGIVPEGSLGGLAVIVRGGGVGAWC